MGLREYLLEMGVLAPYDEPDYTLDIIKDNQPYIAYCFKHGDITIYKRSTRKNGVNKFEEVLDCLDDDGYPIGFKDKGDFISYMTEFNYFPLGEEVKVYNNGVLIHWKNDRFI